MSVIFFNNSVPNLKMIQYFSKIELEEFWFIIFAQNEHVSTVKCQIYHIYHVLGSKIAILMDLDF